MENPTIVTITPPPGMNLVAFMPKVENLPVEPDGPARVVIDEVAGVVVMDENVRISTVAIQQGNLTISVREAPVAVPAAPFTPGQTTTVPQTSVTVNEESGPGHQLVMLQEGASLASLVAGLNALGVSPRDMMQILLAIKAQGGLQAELEVI